MSFLYQENPELLGETLVLASQVCISNALEKNIVYDCGGQLIQFQAAGKPLEIKVTEVTKDGKHLPLFEAIFTGDGITYRFEQNCCGLISQMIRNAASEYSFKQKPTL